MLARKHFVVGFVQLVTLALVLVLGLTGCASMVSSKEELQSLGENEGIVIGSFIINVEKGPEDESGWAFLQGRKSGESEYGVLIIERPTNSFTEQFERTFKTNYRFTAKPEQEFTFIKKLPAGPYLV